MPRDDFRKRPPIPMTPPRDRHPADFGRFVKLEADTPRRQPIRFTGWQLVGLFAAMIVSCSVLSLLTGNSLTACLLSPVVGLVVYELWYLVFEASR